VPHIVREFSGKCPGISECLESGHPVYLSVMVLVFRVTNCHWSGW